MAGRRKHGEVHLVGKEHGLRESERDFGVKVGSTDDTSGLVGREAMRTGSRQHGQHPSVADVGLLPNGAHQTGGEDITAPASCDGQQPRMIDHQGG